MPNVALIGSMTAGACSAPPTAINQGSSNVFVEGAACAFVGSGIVPHPRPKQSPHGGSVSSGSPNVFVNGKPIARIGDPISCGDKIATGSGTVIAN